MFKHIMIKMFGEIVVPYFGYGFCRTVLVLYGSVYYEGLIIMLVNFIFILKKNLKSHL